MKMFYSLVVCAALMVGCARVQVDAPKDPIKMDITMRLDVYQHVVKDIDAIENLVAGGDAGAAKKLSDLILPPAHAEDMDPAVRAAAMNRKERLPALSSFQRAGVIGEGADAMVVLKSSAAGASEMAEAENRDRLVIFKAIAAQNGTAVSEVRKLYAQRLQANAPQGTPIEKARGEWSTK